MKNKLIFLGVVVLLALWAAGSYNGLVRRRESIKGAWGQVENVLQRRYDLIPNLVETVKGYAAHEKSTLEDIAKFRSQWAAAPSPADKMAASKGLEGALGRLMVVMENYPQLKADQTFLKLQDELAGTENRIAVERKRYNEEVQAYNTAAETFPGVITARIFGFGPKPYFEAPETAQAAPKVSFQ
jgi:LemA protein